MRSHAVQSSARLHHLLQRTGVTESLLTGKGIPRETGLQAAVATSTNEHQCRAYCRSAEVSSSAFPSHLSHNCGSLRGLGNRRYASQAATEGEGGGDIHVEISVPYDLHLLAEGPAQEARTTKEELLSMYRHMNTVRRMEITADMLFKAQFVRGFCHLYDGQEAVSVGMEAALTFEDSVLTAYRDHGNYIGRGGTVFETYSELMGKKAGAAYGKGGSMHLYKKEHNFYGGWGIVGSSIPLGTGLGFALKYLKKKNVAVSIYGDGAANQGQLYEAQNIAALWDLPVIYLVENNHYGMGTSLARASKKTTFYDRLSYIPGIKVDGMDVFAVKNAFMYAKEHCLAGKGPIVLEADTYRYHGHSMSDPGSTYRDRSEIQGVRKARDPIEHLKSIILKEEVSTADELKKLEKEAKAEVEEAAAKAKETPLPADDELFSNIYKVDTGLVTYGCDRSRKVQLP